MKYILLLIPVVLFIIDVILDIKNEDLIKEINLNIKHKVLLKKTKKNIVSKILLIITWIIITIYISLLLIDLLNFLILMVITMLTFGFALISNPDLADKNRYILFNESNTQLIFISSILIIILIRRLYNKIRLNKILRKAIEKKDILDLYRIINNEVREMKCPNCGNTIENQNNKFCTYCGTKLDNNEQNIVQEQPNQNNQINQNVVNNNQNMNNTIPNNTNNNTTTFLVIGIIMAICCNQMFGAGIILLNELKYKKELQNGQLDSAKKDKNYNDSINYSGNSSRNTSIRITIYWSVY